MKKLLLCGVLCLLAILPTDAQDSPKAAFRPAPCPRAIPGVLAVDCGYLTVPERHENPDGQMIQLAVVIVRARSGYVRPDAMLYLDGGPGGSGLGMLNYWVGIADTFERDLILLDQRGTGYSMPRVDCTAYNLNVNMFPLLYYSACATAMADDGIDLGAYNSAQGAQDVRALVHALGYDQINLYGISYGTRVALTVMRDVPEIVRAAILDSPYPPHINGLNDRAINAYSAIDSVLTTCGGDEICEAAFPNLRERFYAWVESGERATSEFNSSGIDGPEAMAYLFSILYNNNAIRYVPRALEKLVAGDSRYLSDLISGNYEGSPDYYDGLTNSSLNEVALAMAEKQFGVLGTEQIETILGGLSSTERVSFYRRALRDGERSALLDAVTAHIGLRNPSDARDYLDSLAPDTYERLLSNMAATMAADWLPMMLSQSMLEIVNCIEEVPFNSRNTALQRSRQLPELVRAKLIENVEYLFIVCRGWSVQPARALENELVRSDIPALVLAGQFDPITPPVYAQAAMEGLENGQMVVVPGAGHGVVDSNRCVSALGAAFFDAPTAPLDTSCIKRLVVKWGIKD